MQKRRDRFALQKLHKHGFLKLWGSVPGASEKYFSVQLKKKNRLTNKQTKNRLLKLNARRCLLARSLAKVTVLYS